MSKVIGFKQNEESLLIEHFKLREANILFMDSEDRLFAKQVMQC